MPMPAQYLIRLDDACPTMDWARWTKVFALLDRFDIKPIIGVIPDNKDDTLEIDPPRTDFWDVVAQWLDKGWTIGLHGYQHLYVTQQGGLVPIGTKSEFAGLPLPAQEEKIRKGWAIFQSHGIKPTIWVAPGHSFDSNTLLALKSETDIDLVSDGIALECFVSDGFHWLPQQLWRFRKLPFGTYTICLHPNTMTSREFDDLERSLRTRRESFVSLAEVRFPARKKNAVEKLLAKLYMAALHSRRRRSALSAQT